MPAARKSKTSSARSTTKPPSSRPSGTNRIPCHAWWCDSTFTRRADMMKHVGTEHFGKRFYCSICCAAMKQESNLNTHLNKHFGIHPTLCSCGKGFTDPSACTRHRTATGHAAGITYRKLRPVILKPIGVQHLAGLAITVQMISDPSFIPPPFDQSYHLKGMTKPKGQEKFDATEYLVPSAQAAGPPPEDMVRVAQYEEPPTERAAVAQTDIQVDKFGFNVELSYDVELPQEPQHDRVPAANAYPETPTNHPSCDLRTPPNDYYTSPVPVPHYHPHPAAAPHMPADANWYHQPHPSNCTVAVNRHLPPPPPPQPISGPQIPPEHLEMLQIQSNIPSVSFGMSPHHGFPEMGFGYGMHVPQQFLQQTQYQQPRFHNYF